MNPQPCPPPRPRCWLHHPPMPHLLTINWSQCVLLDLPALPRRVLAADHGSSQSLWETWPGGQQLHPPPEHRLFIAFLGAPGKCLSSKFMIPCVRMSGLLFSLHYLPRHCHRFVLLHVGTKPCLPSKQKGIREVAPRSLSVSSKPNSNSLLKDLTCDIEKI